MVKKYDCCITCGEKDLLEIRLIELKDVVDTFIWVEANVTHTGLPRQFVCNQFADDLCSRYKIDRNRIHVVEVTEMAFLKFNSWERQEYQREALWRALGDVQDDDVVCFSDCDEIPKAGLFLQEHQHLSKAIQHFCYYWANCRWGQWCGSIIGPLASYMNPLATFGKVRDSGLVNYFIPDGGWHFSYFGDIEGVRSKLESFSHTECNTEKWKDARWLRVALNAPLDLFRRWNHQWRFVSLDDIDEPKAFKLYPYKFESHNRWAYFHEIWQSDDHIARLADLWRGLEDVQGFNVEFGCWEGRSAVALANMVYPEKLHCVDPWDQHHIQTYGVCRDVYIQFDENIDALTEGNVIQHRMTDEMFVLCNHKDYRLKFVHLDTLHNYDTVAWQIEHLKPMMVPGGIICGGDWQTASADREDLNGGVQRAVIECCPGFQVQDNLWWWRA